MGRRDDDFLGEIYLDQDINMDAEICQIKNIYVYNMIGRYSWDNLYLFVLVLIWISWRSPFELSICSVIIDYTLHSTEINPIKSSLQKEIWEYRKSPKHIDIVRGHRVPWIITSGTGPREIGIIHGQHLQNSIS